MPSKIKIRRSAHARDFGASHLAAARRFDARLATEALRHRAEAAVERRDLAARTRRLSEASR